MRAIVSVDAPTPETQRVRRTPSNALKHKGRLMQSLTGALQKIHNLYRLRLSVILLLADNSNWLTPGGVNAGFRTRHNPQLRPD
jgi:hypothetical protein